MTRVLIAADGTDQSVEVATVAQRLFGPDAEYLIVNVVDDQAAWAAGMAPALAFPVPYAYPASIDSALFQPQERIDDANEAVRQVAIDSGLTDAEPMVEEGEPSRCILRAAHEHAADVIVVGSGQTGWFSRLLHGSVSDSVVHGADIPVLVAKVPA